MGAQGGCLVASKSGYGSVIALAAALATAFPLSVPVKVGAAELRSVVSWSVTSMSYPYNNLAIHEEYGPTVESGSTQTTYTPSPFDSYGSASGSASASFGALAGQAMVQRSTGTTPNVNSWDIRTSASFFDTITIDAPGLFGQPGTTTFSFSVTGSTTLTATPDSNPYWSFWNGARYYLFLISKDASASSDNFLDYLDADGTGPGTWVTDLIPFTYGSPFDVRVFFNVDARLGVEALALADFDQTAKLSDIDVYDEAGAPVAGFSLISESGTQYPVPEPGTLALCSLGLLCVAGVRRRKN